MSWEDFFTNAICVSEPVRPEYGRKVESSDTLVGYRPSLCPVLLVHSEEQRTRMCDLGKSGRFQWVTENWTSGSVRDSRTRWTIQSLFQGMSNLYSTDCVSEHYLETYLALFLFEMCCFLQIVQISSAICSFLQNKRVTISNSCLDC